MSTIDKEKATKIGDTYAKSIGKESLKDVIEPIKAGLNSDDPTVYDIARQQARTTVEQLTKLILRQEIFTNDTPDYMNKLIGYFDDGYVNEGNAKVYDFANSRGKDTWDKNKFLPTAQTTTDVDEFVIKMYDNGDTLSTQGYQFKKPITFIETQWIPYFKSGNLSQFIADQHAEIQRVYVWFLFDKIARLLTDTNKKPAKQINGQATNAFDAWANEILPAIREMTLLSSDFNYNSANKNLLSTNVSDLIVIASSKTIQTLQSGIKSQLYNAQLLDIKGLIDAENFMNLGKKLTIGDANTKVSTDTTNYVDDNTVIVLSKKALKHIHQIDRVESQFFAENLSTLLVKHVWGAIDWLPWGQAFIYTNTNLNTLP